MSSSSFDNLNELVYVNLSNTNTQKCPINSENTPCVICQEKCNLTFTNAYFQASCDTFDGGLVYSNLTTSAHSYLTFNENIFNVTALYLLAPSINTYSTTETFCDFVIESMSNYGYLIIYIPVVVGTSTTITIPEDLTLTQSLSNINLYNYLPSQMPYYFFNAFYKNSNANYVIFPATSCNVTITSSDYNNLWEISNYAAQNPIKNPSNDYFTLSPGSLNTIYYNKNGANLSGSNDYYLDCQVADYEEIDENPPQSSQSSQTSQSSQSSQNVQFFYNFLAFIILAIVCILLYMAIIHIPKIIN